MSNAGTGISHFIEEPEAPVEEETVSVMLLREKVVIIIGGHTGTKYVFSGAGSIVENVDKQDAELMLQHHISPSCCGSFSTPYFQIVGR